MVARISQAWIMCAWMRATRDSVLKAACRSSARMSPAARADLVHRQLQPQLGRLVDDDEQQLVVLVGRRSPGR